MSKFRIVILVFLVIALIVLGMIYVNISSRMELLHQQAVMAQQGGAQVTPATSASAMPVTMTTQQQIHTQPVVVSDPVISAQLQQVQEEMERLKQENEKLRQQQSLAAEERELIERKAAEQNDPKLQWLNDIKDSPQVGKVSEYYRDANLVLFQALGEQNLSVGQELCVRKRGGIFVSIIVDGTDPEGKIYQAYVKRNTLFDNNKESLAPGDEIILPPPGWADTRPELDTHAAPSASPGAPTTQQPQPVMIPMEP